MRNTDTHINPGAPIAITEIKERGKFQTFRFLFATTFKI